MARRVQYGERAAAQFDHVAFDEETRWIRRGRDAHAKHLCLNRSVRYQRQIGLVQLPASIIGVRPELLGEVRATKDVVDVSMGQQEMPNAQVVGLDIVEHLLPLLWRSRARIDESSLVAIVNDVAIFGKRTDNEGLDGHSNEDFRFGIWSSGLRIRDVQTCGDSSMHVGQRRSSVASFVRLSCNYPYPSVSFPNVKHLHQTILRALPLPFVAAFCTLMFLLLMQFLIRYLPELVGRGLPMGALIELVAYSLAYMVTLAVPMSWLIALLAAFGRLSESRAFLVVKSAGVSLGQLIWPSLIAGIVLAAGMAYFNNVMLPEANYRMADLWRDIRVARPGFELEPGVFYSGLNGYAIRAEDIPPDSTGLLLRVTVFDSSKPGMRTVLVADRAQLATTFGGQRLEMQMEDGELHRRNDGRRAQEERYERLSFDRHRIAFDISDLTFARSDSLSGGRSDRTMRTSEMIAVVDSLERGTVVRLSELGETLQRLSPLAAAPVGRPHHRPLLDVREDSVQSGANRAILDGLSDSTREAVYDLATQRARSLRSEADATNNAVHWELQRANRYRVEIYKKNSIALACLIFVLIGVPLGLAVARGGVGLIATLAVAVFLFYWITLVQGEKLADRGLLSPWLGMWAANVVFGILGLYLTVRENRDPAGRDPIRRLAGLFARRK